MSAHNAEAPDAPDARERPIGELIKELAGQTSTLVRQEIQLAQAELTSKGKTAGRGVGMLVGAAIAGLLALIALTWGLIAALDTGLPLWLAALIVMLLWGIVGPCSPPVAARSSSRPHPPYPRP